MTFSEILSDIGYYRHCLPLLNIFAHIGLLQDIKRTRKVFFRDDPIYMEAARLDLPITGRSKGILLHLLHKLP